MSTMVGRDAELQALRDAFTAGQDGHPRAVVIRGEAGIGKTRLLTEFRDEVLSLPADPPVVIAVGQCVDLGTIGAPFTPVRRLLRELYLGVGDEVFRAAAQTRSVIATLGTLVPDLESADEALPPGRSDFATEAIERIIENLSVDHHLVLIIEDLHWADASTLDLLKTLAVTLRGAHVTMVMTYRSDDVSRGHPLRPVLAELDRSRLVTALELKRLDPDEIAEQIRALSRWISDADLHAVIARSEGVPFFVEELVDLGDSAMPETLRDLVLARYGRLDQSTRDIVGVVAAGGVRVEHSLLAEVHTGDADQFRDGLREAVAANVLVAVGDDYTFRHALIQEAVHDELLPSERAALHRRYAEATQTRANSGQPALWAVAAEHWMQSRDLPRAFDATVAARHHARSTFAYSAATSLGERLVELWPLLPEADERARTSAAALSAELSEELRYQGDFSRSLRVARAGLALPGDTQILERAHLHLAAAYGLGNTGKNAECIAEIDRALDSLDADDATHQALLARALGLKSTLPASLLGGSDERRSVSDAAVLAAERSESDDVIANILLNSCWSLTDSGELREAVSASRRARSLRTGPDLRLQAFVVETDVLNRLGLFEEAVSIGEAGLADAAEVGLERGMGALLNANIAEALLAMGERDRARALLKRTITLLAGAPAFRSFAFRLDAGALVWDDRSAEADALHARELAAIEEICLEDTEEQIGWAEYLTESALAAVVDEPGPVTASDHVRRAVESALVLAEEDFVTSPGTSRRITLAAARALAIAEATGELPGTDMLRSAVETSVASQPDDAPGRALRALVHAVLRTAPPEESLLLWQTAAELPELDFLPVRHRCYARYRLAEALVEAGDRAAAAPVLERLAVEAPGLGVSLVARWARELAARAGITLTTDAALTVSAKAGVAASGVQSLTPRELQVLALVAEGLTNPQIGQRLFISPKTASVHVSAILVKIGASNRTEAAALFSAAATS